MELGKELLLGELTGLDIEQGLIDAFASAGRGVSADEDCEQAGEFHGGSLLCDFVESASCTELLLGLEFALIDGVSNDLSPFVADVFGEGFGARPG